MCVSVIQYRWMENKHCGIILATESPGDTRRKLFKLIFREYTKVTSLHSDIVDFACFISPIVTIDYVE